MILILWACGIMCLLLLILYLLHEEIYIALFDFEDKALEHTAICPHCQQTFAWTTKDILYGLHPKAGYMVFCPHCSELVNVEK